MNGSLIQSSKLFVQVKAAAIGGKLRKTGALSSPLSIRFLLS